MRVALCGASGTGKSTLAAYITETWRLTLNPIGSRSVSKAMGFDSPYDVDKAGQRALFQRMLVNQKCEWEKLNEEFVTERTTLDNLAYTIMHDVKAIDEELLSQVIEGMKRYTHVIWLPVEAFCKLGEDPSRVHDMTYQRMYDVVLEGLLDRYCRTRLLALRASDKIFRQGAVSRFFLSNVGT